VFLTTLQIWRFFENGVGALSVQSYAVGSSTDGERENHPSTLKEPEADSSRNIHADTRIHVRVRTHTHTHTPQIKTNRCPRIPQEQCLPITMQGGGNWLGLMFRLVSCNQIKHTTVLLGSASWNCVSGPMYICLIMASIWQCQQDVVHFQLFPITVGKILNTRQ
jgi:hypothetical protein